MDNQNTPPENQPTNNKSLELIKAKEQPHTQQQNYQQNNFQNNQQYYCPKAMRPLKTDRSLFDFMLYGLLTFNIYNYYCLYRISKDINTIARPYDKKITINYLILIFIISPLTYGIGDLVWYHCLSSRIKKELNRRNLNYEFGARDFWIWKFTFTAIPTIVSTCYSIFTAVCFIVEFIWSYSISPFSSQTETIITIIIYAIKIFGTIASCYYIHKLLKSMNLLSESYNYYGWLIVINGVAGYLLVE